MIIQLNFCYHIIKIDINLIYLSFSGKISVRPPNLVLKVLLGFLSISSISMWLSQHGTGSDFCVL